MRTTYVLRNGKLVEKKKARAQVHEVQIDAYSKNPTVSPVDGSLIASRADLRRHNSRNSVLDVGNDSSLLRREEAPMPSEKEIASHLNEMYQRFDQNDPEAMSMARSGREPGKDRRIYG